VVLQFAGLLDNHDRTHSPGGSTGVWKPRSGCHLIRKNSRRGGENRKNLQVSGLDHKIGGMGMVSKSVSNTVHMVRITPIYRPTLISWNIGPIHWIFSREHDGFGMVGSKPDLTSVILPTYIYYNMENDRS
jgi:hypothetical protein